jgi:hypothetical protein
MSTEGQVRLAHNATCDMCLHAVESADLPQFDLLTVERFRFNRSTDTDRLGVKAEQTEASLYLMVCSSCSEQVADTIGKLFAYAQASRVKA